MSGPSGLDPRSADARFVALYSDYHTLCYQVAWDVLGHHDQALDAAQEVFLQLLAGLPPLRTRVFELCYGLGYSSRDAAEELRVSQKAVEKQREKLERDLRRFRGGGRNGGLRRLIEARCCKKPPSAENPMSDLKKVIVLAAASILLGAAASLSTTIAPTALVAQTETCNNQICGTSCRPTALPRNCDDDSGLGGCSYTICD